MVVLCRLKDKVLCGRCVIACDLDTGWANAHRRPTVEQPKGFCESSGLRLATVGGEKCTGRFFNTTQQVSNSPAPLRPHRRNDLRATGSALGRVAPAACQESDDDWHEKSQANFFTFASRSMWAMATAAASAAALPVFFGMDFLVDVSRHQRFICTSFLARAWRAVVRSFLVAGIWSIGNLLDGRAQANILKNRIGPKNGTTA